jgi:GNAT superfamily N-acetyltransferase
VSMVKQIRFARPSERSALNSLHRRSSYVWEADRADLEAHPDALGVAPEAITEGRLRVAVGPDDGILGFSVAVYAADGVCELDDLFVDPDFMRMGIGRALVEDAAARASSAGCREMTVVFHERNFAFYESVGFLGREPTSTRFGPATLLRRPIGTRDG